MAKTFWWYCNNCGFRNHPRNQQAYPLTPQINEGCEQCGSDRKEGVDYLPTGAAAVGS